MDGVAGDDGFLADVASLGVREARESIADIDFANVGGFTLEDVLDGSKRVIGDGFEMMIDPVDETCVN